MHIFLGQSDTAGAGEQRTLGTPYVTSLKTELPGRPASQEDIDAMMKPGANHPKGPPALADLIGLDVVLDIMETLYQGFDDPKYRPSPLLKQMCDAGYWAVRPEEAFSVTATKLDAPPSAFDLNQIISRLCCQASGEAGVAPAPLNRQPKEIYDGSYSS